MRQGIMCELLAVLFKQLRKGRALAFKAALKRALGKIEARSNIGNLNAFTCLEHRLYFFLNAHRE